MINIFSQLIKGDDIDYVYDCSVDDNDSICISKKISNDDNILSIVKIEFLNLRDLIKINDKIFETKDLIIIIEPDLYKFYSKKHEGLVLLLEITLSKVFLFNAYKALEQMWVDD